MIQIKSKNIISFTRQLWRSVDRIMMFEKRS